MYTSSLNEEAKELQQDRTGETCGRRFRRGRRGRETRAERGAILEWNVTQKW